MNKKLTESAFELMLREAAINAEAESGREYELPSEEIEFSKLHERKMKKLFLKEKRKENAPKRKKLIASVACIILILFVGTGTAIVSVDAWRESVINYFFDKERPNTDFNFRQNGGKTYSDEEIRLKYVPMGFEIAQNQFSRSVKIAVFEKGEHYFNLSISKISVNKSIDTEDAEIKEVVINGNKAVYSTNKNANILIWSDGEYVFSVYGNISEAEIIRIGSGIEVLKKLF